MAFLRVLRVFFVVAGLGLTALGLIMIATEARISGGTVGAAWTCEADGNGMRCNTNSGSYSGPGGLVDTLGWLGLPIGGLALIGAAIALGQFDRPRQPSAPGLQYSGAPGPGQQPTQAGRPPGSW